MPFLFLVFENGMRNLLLLLLLLFMGAAEHWKGSSKHRLLCSSATEEEKKREEEGFGMEAVLYLFIEENSQNNNQVLAKYQEGVQQVDIIKGRFQIHP